MHLYLDTADSSQWQQIAGVARIQGVTTNPTLVRQAGLYVDLTSYEQLILKAKQNKMPALMLQLPSADVEAGINWVSYLTERANGVELTFKMPCHVSWQKLHTAVRKFGGATLLTGVSNSMQLLWAADQGANFVAPYLGRLEAQGRDIRLLIDAMSQVQYSEGPKIMAASIKSADVFSYLLACGAYACTAKPEFYQQLAEDEVTFTAMKQFEIDCLVS